MSIIGNDCLRALAELHVNQAWKQITSVSDPAIACICKNNIFFKDMIFSFIVIFDACLSVFLKLVTKYEKTILLVKQSNLNLTVCNLYAPRYTEGMETVFFILYLFYVYLAIINYFHRPCIASILYLCY